MPVSFADIAGGFLAPVAFACVVMVVLHRVLPEGIAHRVAGTVALVGGFTVGYALLGLGQWSPKFFWHWLPYVVLATLPVGPLLAGVGRQRVAGWVLMLGVVLWGGWLLVPTWEHLEPSRATHMVVWMPAVIAPASLLAPWDGNRHENKAPPERLPATLFVTILTATMFFAVAIIFLSGSLRFSQLAGAAFAAMLGVMLAVVLDRKGYGSSGIVAPFSILLGGLLLIARVDSHSSVPLASYVLLPLAPLALWVAVVKPICKLQTWRRWLALCSLPIALLLVSLIMAMVAEFGAEQY